MKKLLCILISALLVALTLCACTGSNGDDEEKIDTSSLPALTIGVPVGKEPAYTVFFATHSRMAKKGYRVEYVEYASAEEANTALANGEIDLSIVAQKKEFDEYNKANPETLLNLGPVYRFPYGIFLCNFEEFEDITDKATIAIPKDPEGVARALLLLEANGLITLKEGAGLAATLDDIEDNSRNFEFVLQDDKTLAANIDNYEADIAVMSSQLCVDAGHALNKTARAIEEIGCEAAKEYAYVLLINRDEIASDFYKATSPLYFSPLVYETVDIYSGDLIVPAFSLAKKGN